MMLSERQAIVSCCMAFWGLGCSPTAEQWTQQHPTTLDTPNEIQLLADGTLRCTFADQLEIDTNGWTDQQIATYKELKCEATIAHIESKCVDAAVSEDPISDDHQRDCSLLGLEFNSLIALGPDELGTLNSEHLEAMREGKQAVYDFLTRTP